MQRPAMRVMHATASAANQKKPADLPKLTEIFESSALEVGDRILCNTGLRYGRVVGFTRNGEVRFVLEKSARFPKPEKLGEFVAKQCECSCMPDNDQIYGVVTDKGGYRVRQGGLTQLIQTTWTKRDEQVRCGALRAADVECEPHHNMPLDHRARGPIGNGN